MALQIPALPVKTVLCFHLFLFIWANFATTLSPAWFWSNFLIIALLFRLVDAAVVPGATDAATEVSELLLYIYVFTIINDIICFSISVVVTSGQTFSLTMACFALVGKPFLVPSLLVDMKSRGGALGGFADRLGGGAGAGGGGYGAAGGYDGIPAAEEAQPVYGGGGNTIV